MSVTINGNQGASIALRALQRAQAAMDRSLSKLSSGQKAQSARDDAAGLAISSRLTGQIASLQKYALNAQQGVSLLQVAEGTYQRAQDMLVRMRSLASQAQGSNLSASERGMLDTEYQQLKLEITRMAKSTSFGGQLLFDSGNIQYGSGQTITMTPTSNMGYEIGDFNGDGIADMMYEDGGDTANVFFAYGRNDGSFSAPVAFNTGVGGPGLVKGDFNGDGKLDFAVHDGTTVYTFINNGTGTFTAGTTFAPTGGGALTLAAGDLDGDGKDDLVISQQTSPAARWISILYADGTSQRIATTNNVTWDHLSVVDMNNDGKMDIMMSSQSAIRVGTLMNNGNKSYTVTTPYFVAGGLSQASGLGDLRNNLVDWDGDGLLDFISTNGSDVFLFKNNNGTFSTTTNITNTGGANFLFDNVTVADFDGDGRYDIAGYDQNTSSLVILKNGNWTSPITVGATDAYYIRSADFNRDGKMDLIAWNAGGTLTSYLNTTSIGLESTVRVSDSPAASNNIGIRTASMRLNSLDQGLEVSMINSIGAAKRSEASLKRAMDMLAIYRTGVGASVNRLEKVQDNISTMIENLESARSAIADVDVAEEMSNFIAQQMIVQAGISMIAQANANQRKVLQALLQF